MGYSLQLYNAFLAIRGGSGGGETSTTHRTLDSHGIADDAFVLPVILHL